MPKHNRNKPIKNFLKFNKISLIKKNLLKIKNKKKIWTEFKMIIKIKMKFKIFLMKIIENCEKI